MFPARLVSLALLMALAPGCRWLGGDKSGGGSTPDRAPPDPLLGMRRIDPQTGVLSRDPVAKTNDREATGESTGRRRGGANDLPPRTSSDPYSGLYYRPSPASSTAAMASGQRFDSELEINRGDDGQDRGGLTEVTRQLRDAGATVGKAMPNGEGWSVGATVPIAGEPPGSRRFTGRGTTPELAARDALEQVRSHAK